MYCPKCNLHTQEYSDKCPLCDGRLRADEEVRKRTAQSQGKEVHWTRELILSKAKEILGETELQELAHPEEPREEEKAPPPQEKAVPPEHEKLPDQQGRPFKGRRSGSKRILLIVLGILILAVLGYFFLLPSEKPSIPPKTKTAATRKKLPQTKPMVSSRQPAVKEQEKIAEPKLQELDQEKPSPQPEKAPASLTDEEAKEPSITTAETPVSSAPPARPQGTYSIHVGSFKVKENAFDLRDRLQKKGYPVQCYLLTIPEKGEWYRVEVGYYSVLEEAQQALSKLESEEKIADLSLIGP